MIKKDKEYFDNLREKTALKYILACFFGGFFGLPFYFRNKTIFVITLILLPFLNFFLMGFLFFIFSIEGIGRLITYMAGKFDYDIFRHIKEEQEKNLLKDNLELQNFEKLSKKEQLKYSFDRGNLTKERYDKMLGLVILNELQEDLKLKLIKEKDLEKKIGEFQKEKIKDTDDFQEYEKANIIDKLRILFLNDLITLEELGTIEKHS